MVVAEAIKRIKNIAGIEAGTCRRKVIVSLELEVSILLGPRKKMRTME
jgi:hypothetical protein